MGHTIRLATRRSPLALAQANHVRSLLLERNPDVGVEIVGMTTTGDRSATSPSQALSGKGDFLKELELALLDQSADLAVHSMKDVPSSTPKGLRISAIGNRADARDALIGVKSLSELSVDSCIGTSSARRSALLKHVTNRSNIKPIRGNVDTRLAKLDNREVDALVLACAGLSRLGLEQRIGCFLDPSIFVPAAGQGCLAVEFRAGDEAVKRILDPLISQAASAVADCERAVVRELQADCNAPMGVYCAHKGSIYHLYGVVLDPNGDHSVRVSLADESTSTLADRAAEQLIAMGALDLIKSA